eukprot:gb/GECG01009804.1/.p1 GENE.gb/GECG01009804.1/~~gb/GECG01009804.1/.p1  ORF type:complete len:265 (+),score=40.48 gb/GECG01009804.1/:1-795(+)
MNSAIDRVLQNTKRHHQQDVERGYLKRGAQRTKAATPKTKTKGTKKSSTPPRSNNSRGQRTTRTGGRSRSIGKYGRAPVEDYDKDDEIPPEFLQDQDADVQPRGSRRGHEREEDKYREIHDLDSQSEESQSDVELSDGDAYLATPPKYEAKKETKNGGTRTAPVGIRRDNYRRLSGSPGENGKWGHPLPNHKHGKEEQQQQQPSKKFNYMLWIKGAFIAVMTILIIQTRSLAGKQQVRGITLDRLFEYSPLVLICVVYSMYNFS